MPVDYSISLILPEIILGFGALALLMVGAFRGEKSAELVTGLAVVVIAFALLGVCFANHGDTLSATTAPWSRTISGASCRRWR